ncbi:MAG: SDR family NAD(P)-dependent oxidoreductase, partial [Polyangiales bacterium]
EARTKRRAHDRAVLDATAIRGASSATVSRTLSKPRDCYVCKAAYVEVDAFYDSLCPACARENVAKRAQIADLRGRRAVVTGGRVKIGFQIALSLLRGGASVELTTRFPCDAALRYAREPDFESFADRLQIHGLDLRDLGAVERFTHAITLRRHDVDILVNNAAQTVRRPPAFFRHLLEVESAGPEALPAGVGRVVAPIVHHRHAQLSQLPLLPGDTNDADFPPGELDANGQQIDKRALNSWALLVDEVDRRELVEVHHVNAFAPFVLVSRLLPHMLASPHAARFVVNVSAMEGKFDYRQKRPNHPHTNMAKASLNMLTRTSGPTLAQWGIYMTSVDTGWITNEQPLMVAERMAEVYGFTLPLTEADGAARVLDPVLSAVNGAPPQHSVFLKDYRVTSW